MNEFQGTWLQELIKNVILSFSALGLGAALWLAVYDILKGIRARGHERRLWLSRGGFVACFIGIILLLSEAIFKADQPLPVEWRTILYTVLIVGAAVCGAGIVYESRRADKQNERKGRYL